jgi:beta-glucosidase/6-phospho-beta-glucosidase/beta-galactosidase
MSWELMRGLWNSIGERLVAPVFSLPFLYSPPHRRDYQPTQGGAIGITLNIDWSYPLNSSSPEDSDAAERRNEFMFSWFADPIFFGEYPPSMRSGVSDHRLPEFTAEESKRVMGSVDFLGFNHYSSWYVSDAPRDPQSPKPGDWFTDQRASPR